MLVQSPVTHRLLTVVYRLHNHNIHVKHFNIQYKACMAKNKQNGLRCVLNYLLLDRACSISVFCWDGSIDISK